MPLRTGLGGRLGQLQPDPIPRVANGFLKYWTLCRVLPITGTLQSLGPFIRSFTSHFLRWSDHKSTSK